MEKFLLPGRGDREICALLSGRSQMKGDGVSQTKDHSKLGIKQHLVESLGLQAHQNICVDQEVSTQNEEKMVAESGEKLSYGNCPLFPSPLSKIV